MKSILFAQVYTPVFKSHFHYLCKKGYSIHHITNDPHFPDFTFPLYIYRPILDPLDPFKVSHGLSLLNQIKFPSPLSSIDDLLLIDRICRLRNYKSVYQQLLQLLSEIYSYLTTHSFDIVVGGRDSALHLLTYIVCEHLGIKYLTLTRLRIPQDRYFFTPSPFSYSLSPDIIGTYNHYNPSQSIYLSPKLHPLTKVRYPLIDLFTNLRYYFSLFLGYIIHNRSYKSSGILNYRITELVYRFFLRFIHSILLSKRQLFSGPPINLNTPYILFFLQTQPESSIDVEGFPFLDQFKLLHQVSENLHSDYILVVKPHPGDYNIFPPELYSKLKLLHNVCILSPSSALSTKTLIHKSQLVFTISGTIGLEALLVNKPTLVLGAVWFKHLSSLISDLDLDKLLTILRNPNRFIDTWKLHSPCPSNVYELYLDNCAFGDYNRSYSGSSLSHEDISTFCNSVLLNIGE